MIFVLCLHQLTRSLKTSSFVPLVSVFLRFPASSMPFFAIPFVFISYLFPSIISFIFLRLNSLFFLLQVFRFHQDQHCLKHVFFFHLSQLFIFQLILWQVFLFLIIPLKEFSIIYRFLLYSFFQFHPVSAFLKPIVFLIHPYHHHLTHPNYYFYPFLLVLIFLTLLLLFLLLLTFFSFIAYQSRIIQISLSFLEFL